MDLLHLISGAIFLFAILLAGCTLFSTVIEARNQPAYKKFEKPIFAAAVLDATVAAVPLADAIATMNPDVFQAMDRWVVHSSSPWSLVNYVRDHHATIFAADGGFIDGLKGYVAESIVGDHFAALGHHVVLATTSNQPGWDLLIDNQPFQVKAGMTAVAATRHALERYPDIPVITDSSAAAHLATLDPHAITAVHEIAAKHLEATTTQTLHGLDAIAHVGQVHVPFITIGVSSYLELRLLMQGHTTFQRAVANVAIDAVGVAAGAAVGAKSGAALGAIANAPGIAAGAILGGIVGAFVGKFGATALKAAAFEKLRQDYFVQVRLAREDLRQEELRSERVLASALKRIDARLQLDRRQYARVAARASYDSLARRRRAIRLLRKSVKRIRKVSPLLRPTLTRAMAIMDHDVAKASALLVSLIPEVRLNDMKSANLLEDAVRRLLHAYRCADRIEHAAKTVYAEMLFQHDLESRGEAARILQRLAGMAKRRYAKANELQAALVKESRALGKPLALPGT
jgi:hypothetical protein